MESNATECNDWEFCLLLGVAAICLLDFVLVFLSFVDLLIGFGGNRHFWLLILASFLPVALAIILSGDRLLGRAFARHPKGLSERSKILRSSKGLWAPCIAILFITGILAFLGRDMLDHGVPSGRGPVLERQAVYHLNSHGDFTTVSRTKYVTIGIIDSAYGCVLPVLINLVILYYLAFGEGLAFPGDKPKEEDKEKGTS